jgi:hypothetical protein
MNTLYNDFALSLGRQENLLSLAVSIGTQKQQRIEWCNSYLHYKCGRLHFTARDF